MPPNEGNIYVMDLPNTIKVAKPLDFGAVITPVIILEGGEMSGVEFYMRMLIPACLFTLYIKLNDVLFRRKVASKMFYLLLFVLHLLDITLDAFFFSTVRIRYEEFFIL